MTSTPPSARSNSPSECIDFKDYYTVLGLGPFAAENEIKTKYRTLIKQWHPDKAESAAVSRSNSVVGVAQVEKI